MWIKVMVWRQSSDKPLSEPMMTNLLTHICVTRPQWVKNEWHSIILRNKLDRCSYNRLDKEGGNQPNRYLSEREENSLTGTKSVVLCHTDKRKFPDSKVHGANMGPTLILSAPDGTPCWPHEPCYQGYNVLLRLQISQYPQSGLKIKMQNKIVCSKYQVIYNGSDGDGDYFLGLQTLLLHTC